MNRKIALIIVTGIILLAGCNFPLAAAVAPTADISPVSSLTLDLLQKGTYHTPTYAMDVTLIAGKHEAGSGLDFFSVAMLPETAFGDLNSDGIEDAAILLAENQGGTGTFVSVIAVLNQAGQPLQAGTAFVDDRPVINSISIQQGIIELAAVIHAPNDPMVSPTQSVTQTFRLEESGLVLIRMRSAAANGSERSISISDPAEGSEVSGFVTLKGNMPIAPFENNLVYRVFDMQGTQLAIGSFLVDAADMGAPATFAESIDLSDVPAGTRIRLELVEKSPADGATLSLDSVELLVK